MILVVAATALELEQLDWPDTLVCGIGPVEAAIATAGSLAERRPDAVLQVGIAGGRGLAPPTIVFGSEAVYCDVQDEHARFPRVERVSADPRLLERARTALPSAVVLPIGTTAKVGNGAGCDVEAMEGFAVLRAAQLAGVPALELRAISNDPEEPDRDRWQFAEALAALAGATERVLAELERP